MALAYQCTTFSYLVCFSTISDTERRKSLLLATTTCNAKKFLSGSIGFDVYEALQSEQCSTFQSDVSLERSIGNLCYELR